jgi:hypothetical protein
METVQVLCTHLDHPLELANFRELARARKFGLLNRAEDFLQMGAFAENHLGTAMNLPDAELGASVFSHQRPPKSSAK